MPERGDYSDTSGNFQVSRLDAFDQNGDAPAFQSVDHFGDHPGTGRVEHAKLGQTEDDDEDVIDFRYAFEHSVRRPKEERSVEAEQGDVFVCWLGRGGKLFPVNPARFGQVSQCEECGEGDADSNSDDEVNRDGDNCRDDEHNGVGAS